jgi:hypothetical protein
MICLGEFVRAAVPIGAEMTPRASLDFADTLEWAPRIGLV